MRLVLKLPNLFPMKLARLAKKLQYPSLPCHRTKTLPLRKQLICAR
jgi:hypothetical protein